MFRHLRNLWGVSKYRSDTVEPNTQQHPAEIVNMEAPIDLFPSEEPELK